MKKYIVAIAILGIQYTQAQTNNKVKGKLTGFIESNIQYYNKEDEGLGFVAPDNRFRSNNYLKLDYTRGAFTIGTQFEAYESDALLGYPENLKGNGFTNYYATYATQKVTATVGHFYEQFGSGLVLRSWEDRQLGLNNAILGARVKINPTNWLTTKLIGGKKRNAYSTGDGLIWGADVEATIKNDIAKKYFVSAGLSYVGKKEDYIGSIPNFPTTIHLVSTRFNYQKNKLELNAEFAIRTKDGTINDVGDLINTNRYFVGDVIQIGGSYNSENSGVTFVVRQVNNFTQKTDRKALQNQLLLNYIPALTKQHHYSLTNIYVYNPQTRFSFLPGNILNAVGEIGGQIEWFKNFPKKSKIGGKYGLQLNVHLSNYAGLAFSTIDIETAKISNIKTNKTNFRDFNIEIKKTWSKKLKTNFTYVNLLYNQKVIEGFGSEELKANTVVIENIIKLKGVHSLRTDIQHMWVENGKGNWAAFTLEYSIAPSLNFFVADLYNYGNEFKKVHYYNTGMSFTKGSGRIMVSYGRQREGLLCVGGVCRLVPAATGLTINTTFNF